MAEKNIMNLNISFEELQKNLGSPEDFKAYFLENAYQDDSVKPQTFPLDGDKEILIQRWINTDFNEWWCGVNRWNGHRFDKKAILGEEWVKLVEKALPDEDA